jgi:thiol-disulfide isomerase/thioredoxin
MLNKYYGLSIISWVIIFVLIVVYFLFHTNNNQVLVKEEFNSNDNLIKVYNFNTSWCGYSRAFQPVWDKFSKHLKQNNIKNIQAIDVKCDGKKNEEMCNEYQITGFPTVIIEKDNERHTYNDERTVEKLLENIKKL